MSGDCDHLVFSMQQNIIYLQRMRFQTKKENLKRKLTHVGLGKVPLYQINHLHKSPKLVSLDIIIWFGIKLEGVRQIDGWVHVM